MPVLPEGVAIVRHEGHLGHGLGQAVLAELAAGVLAAGLEPLDRGLAQLAAHGPGLAGLVLEEGEAVLVQVVLVGAQVVLLPEVGLESRAFVMAADDGALDGDDFLALTAKFCHGGLGETLKFLKSLKFLNFSSKLVN